MRVALYARVSTEDQVEKYGLPLQRAAFAEYVARHALDDAGPEHHYVDEGYSGTTLERPELDRLLADLARLKGPSRPFDAVVVYDEDRLSRSVVGYSIALDALERRGVGLLTIHERPDTENSPERTLQRQIKASFAEYQRTQFLERGRQGRLARARAGKYVGPRPPYGYTYVKATGMLVVNTDEAAVVRDIFEAMGKRGGTIGSIAADLTRRGIRSPNADRSDLGVNGWAESSIGRILRQTAYLGEWNYNRRRTVEPTQHRDERQYRNRRKTAVTARPESEWIAVPVPSIIERPLWDAAQAQMDWNRRKHERNVKRFYLLRTMVRHDCGSPLGGNPSHDVRYYRCPACRVGIKADTLEDAVWSEIARLLRDPGTVEEGLRARQGQGTVEAQAVAARLDRARRAMAENRADEDRLMDAALARTFSLEAIESRVAKVRAERERLSVEIQEAEQASVNAQLVDVRLQAVSEACAAIAGRLEQLEPNERHWLLQRLGVQVTWSKDAGVDMSGYLPESPVVALVSGDVHAVAHLPNPASRRWTVAVPVAA